MELGRYGVFGRAAVLTPERARMIESLGYGTVWQGGSPPADLSHVAAILDATSTIKVATGIVNVWTADAAEVARSYHRRVELGMQLPEPVLDLRTRLPADLLADPLSIRSEAERDHAPPAPSTGPVVDAVPAVRPVIEVDAVLAVATALSVGHAASAMHQVYELAPTMAPTQCSGNSNVAADPLFLGGAEGI